MTGPARALLPPEVAERLGPYYVYLLVDPRDGCPFYVGKGTRDRLLAHGRQADLAPEVGQSKKVGQIRTIRSFGLQPRIEVVCHGLTEREALLVEAALIDCMSGLTNKVAGHQSQIGRTLLDELAVRYGAKELVATEPAALLIRLRPGWNEHPDELEPGYFPRGAGWRPGITLGELLDSVRGWWKINPRSIEKRGVHHAVAVVEGVTRGIFEIVDWLPRRADGRWAFVGRPVTKGRLHESYVGVWGKRVPFLRHSQNPISFWPFNPTRPTIHDGALAESEPARAVWGLQTESQTESHARRDP